MPSFETLRQKHEITVRIQHNAEDGVMFFSRDATQSTVLLR